ncbi:MAG: porin [Gammaproteobacteria bacterium]|nr:MAG: porin [Gammaproteobacteria bacterium]
MKNMTIKTSLTALTLAMGLAAAQQASAANWLMLQGTEPAGSAPRAKVWGFIQAQYQKDFSKPFAHPSGNDVYIPPKLIGPNLDDQEQFNVNRARIGVRGSNFPLDSKTNYFVLLEMGRNGITEPGNAFAKVTDASVTFNHIPGARVRVGLFKNPGPEEGLQAIHVFDYINFTTVTNQLMLERFADSNDMNYVGPIPGKPLATVPNANMNQFSNSVGAFRDTGVQIFDTFNTGGLETAYAIKVGNGNGMQITDNDSNKDVYLYISTEKVFGGKGPRREGWKFFAWSQTGKRTDPYTPTTEYDRKRYGAGTKYLKRPFRVTAEYMKGKGVIFQGPHKPQNQYNDFDASGWYVEGGWYIPKTNFEVDLRYDTYTRQTNAAGSEDRFKTTTVGAQYHFNKKTRFTLEYDIRNADSDSAGTQKQFDGIGNRVALQVTAIF